MQSIGVILLLIATQQFVTCYGQEKPLFDIRHFWNVSVRQDFCTIHRLMEDGKIKRRDALRGMNLHTVLFSHQLNAETGTIDEAHPDAAVHFLDELARRAGFQWRNTYGVIETPEANLNTWTDVLRWASTTYDLVGEYFLRTEERMELGTLFSASWADSSIIMVKKSDVEVESSSSFFNFLTPFTYGLWGLIAITIIITGFVYYLLDYLDCRRYDRKKDLGFRDSMFNAAWLFTGHTLQEPKSSSTRLLVFSSSFLCLLTVAAYTANLVSFLLPKTDRIIINDIRDVIRNDLKCCIDKAAPEYEFMKKYHPKVKLVPIADPSWAYETYYALARSQCDILITDVSSFEKNKRSSEYNPNCSLERVGGNIHDQKGYFPVMDSSKLCSSVISEVLALHLLEMKQDKTFNTIWENIYLKSATVFCKDANERIEDTRRLSVANMYGIFVIYFAILFVAILLSFYHLFCNPHTSIVVEFLSDIRKSIIGSLANEETPTITSIASHPTITSNVSSTQRLGITATPRSSMATNFVQDNRPLNESIKQLEENIFTHLQMFCDKIQSDKEDTRNELLETRNELLENDKESRECMKNYLEKFEENMTKKMEENMNKKLEKLQSKISAIEKKQI